MDSLHPSYPARRASSTMARPRPTAARTMTSSSTGTARVPLVANRRDSLPARPHRDSTASYRSGRSHRDSFATDNMTFDALSTGDYSHDEDEEDEEWERGEVVGEIKKKRKHDEPMSPVTVVLYVVFFYIIWQILTRSDETEILGHLPLGHFQSLSSNLHSDLRPQSQYHLPYHLPQIPSPIPNAQTESTSTFRTILGVIIYPVYVVITLVATPFPLLLNALHLLAHVLGTVLYPVTATCRLFGRTFVLAPLGVISSVLAVFYPVYVFVGGVIGVGCVLGLGAGWIGKLVLNTLSGRKRHSKETGGIKRTRSRSTASGRTKTRRPSSVSHSQSQPQRSRRKALSPSTEEERERLYTPQVKHVPIFDEAEMEEDRYQPVAEYPIDRKRRHRGSVIVERDKEPAAVGLRRRGVRDSWHGR